MNRSISSVVPISMSKYDGSLHSTEMTEMASSVKNCRLNDNFGLIVQGILAAVAFSTLICE